MGIRQHIRSLKIFALCIMAVLCNLVFAYFVNGVVKLPIYLDTVFTIAVCFSAGLAPGIVTGVLFYPLGSFLVSRYIMGLSVEISLMRNIFFFCILFELLLVWFFYAKMKKQEAVFLEKASLHSFVGMATQLLVLVALDCIVISLTGGIIDFILTVFSAPRTFFPEDTFKVGLLQNNVPLLLTAILSRIPINIVNRFFVIFGGYGISLFFRKWIGITNNN